MLKLIWSICLVILCNISAAVLDAANSEYFAVPQSVAYLRFEYDDANVGYDGRTPKRVCFYDTREVFAESENKSSFTGNGGFFRGFFEFLAAEGATKINNAAKAVEEFLGGEGKIIKNADGDAILMKGDKKIRFDVNDPHGDAPHFHLEQQTRSGKWKDARPEHRNYFEK